MEDKTVTAEELMDALQDDFRALAQKMASAMNAAKPGRIIADTEMPVYDAHTEFRQHAYQKGIDLLTSQAGQQAFSPSAGQDGQDDSLEEQGAA